MLDIHDAVSKGVLVCFKYLHKNRYTSCTENGRDRIKDMNFIENIKFFNKNI
jgi:hypothetical protein